MNEIGQIIAQLGMRPLPGEGGWFAPVWRSGERLPDVGWPERPGRAAGSSILYLLAGAEFSALHRLRSDEVWHFHAGEAIELLRLDPASGEGEWVRLGPAVLAGEAPQVVVPRGFWQGARLASGSRWALLGCTMAPGWDDADFELGRRAELTAMWPQFDADIAALTRGDG
ncbi:MAG: cupin domain-containing protein [Opitutaceae bacterium]